MQTQTPSPKKLLRLPSVLERIGISKTEFYRRVKQGSAPNAIKLGSNSVAWLESDIEQYIDKLVKGGVQ